MLIADDLLRPLLLLLFLWMAVTMILAAVRHFRKSRSKKKGFVFPVSGTYQINAMVDFTHSIDPKTVVGTATTNAKQGDTIDIVLFQNDWPMDWKPRFYDQDAEPKNDLDALLDEQMKNPEYAAAYRKIVAEQKSAKLILSDNDTSPKCVGCSHSPHQPNHCGGFFTVQTNNRPQSIRCKCGRNSIKVQQ